MARRLSRASLRAQAVPGSMRGMTASLPAPVGGLNARDAWAEMAETDAILLDNFFPQTADVQLRNGYVNWTTGYPGQVETLMYYASATLKRLFAVASGNIYNSTTQGAVPAPMVTGLSNSRFQYANFETIGGWYLLAVNGQDNLQRYDGTSWKGVTDTSVPISTLTHVGVVATVTTTVPHNRTTGDIVTVAGATPTGYNGTWTITVTGANTFTYTLPADPGSNASPVGAYTVAGDITGAPTNTFIHVNLFKSRLFFVQNNSFNVWYLPINAIAGKVSQLDLGPLFRLGGYLMAMGTFTFNSATGIDDYALFLSSEGEIAVYQGTDPSNASAWSLVGMFRIGRPAGRRCFRKVGADLVVICADGFFSMTTALVDQRYTPNDALSYKITNAATTDVQNYINNFGWEVCLYPIGNKLIFNVPVQVNSNQYQYVMNTITKQWCRFTGWQANCFELFGDQLMFGGSNFVAWADTGTSDAGASIVGQVQQAFSYYGTPGQQKKFNMARPIIYADANINLTMSINTDFSTATPTSVPSYSVQSGTPWNTAPWNTFPWGGVMQLRKNWQTVSGIGFCGSLRLAVASSTLSMRWQATDFLFEQGGVL